VCASHTKRVGENKNGFASQIVRSGAAHLGHWFNFKKNNKFVKSRKLSDSCSKIYAEITKLTCGQNFIQVSINRLRGITLITSHIWKTKSLLFILSCVNYWGRYDFISPLQNYRAASSLGKGFWWKQYRYFIDRLHQSKAHLFGWN